MAIQALKVLAVAMVSCGVCPPSAIINLHKRFCDSTNVFFRLILVILYCYTEIWKPSKLDMTSRTFYVYAVLMRSALVVHHLMVLAAMVSFGRCISRVHHLKINYYIPLLQCALYACLMFYYTFFYNATFRFPLLFFFFSLTGCVLIVSVQTMLFAIYYRQVQGVNCLS